MAGKIMGFNTTNIINGLKSTAMGVGAIYVSDAVDHHLLKRVPKVGEHALARRLALGLVGVLAMDSKTFYDAGLVAASYNIAQAGYTVEKFADFMHHDHLNGIMGFGPLSDNVLSEHAKEAVESIEADIADKIAAWKTELSTGGGTLSEHQGTTLSYQTNN